MMGTALDITAEILFRPPQIVTMQVIPMITTETILGMPKACCMELVTASVCTQQVQGPNTKQKTASTTAPLFQPKAFFITKDRSQTYSSIDFL